MYSHGVLSQIQMYCECYHRGDADRPCVCLYKAECDDIRRTYGTTPDNLDFMQKEGALSMELPSSTLPGKPKKVYATEAQKDYIIGMLDELCQDLSDYTDTEIDALTIGEASEVIDELRDALDFERQD